MQQVFKLAVAIGVRFPEMLEGQRLLLSGKSGLLVLEAAIVTQVVACFESVSDGDAASSFVACVFPGAGSRTHLALSPRLRSSQAMVGVFHSWL